jgi:hypothetical protein
MATAGYEETRFNMTVEDLRNLVKKKYRIGQKITFMINENDRHGGKKVTATIIDFYPSSVLLACNGFKESYRYWDFLHLTSNIKKDKKTTVKEGRNQNRVAS